MATIEAAQNQRQTNTEGWEKLLNLEIAAKVMWTVHLEIQDHITTDQIGNISHIVFVKVVFKKSM